LIETYSEKLQAEKQLAAALLESYQVQTKLVHQHQRFFIDVGELNQEILTQKSSILKVMTGLDVNNAQEKQSELNTIKSGIDKLFRIKF
jgi:hypothetical protein